MDHRQAGEPPGCSGRLDAQRLEVLAIGDHCWGASGQSGLCLTARKLGIAGKVIGQRLHGIGAARLERLAIAERVDGMACSDER